MTEAPARSSSEWKPVISELVGRFVSASNATLLATTDTGDRVVYKPAAGERPLWDFPSETLAAREVLTYEIDHALGFGMVPETVLGEGPYGTGAIQKFVSHDEEFDPLDLVQRRDASLWPMAVLDVVCNNADRKLGHILQGENGLVAIDHGLTFHPQDKLRTVLWVFAGDPVPAHLIEVLRTLRESLSAGLGARILELLSTAELEATAERVDALIRASAHPMPPDDRPAIPWPPY